MIFILTTHFLSLYLAKLWSGQLYIETIIVPSNESPLSLLSLCQSHLSRYIFLSSHSLKSFVIKNRSAKLSWNLVAMAEMKLIAVLLIPLLCLIVPLTRAVNFHYCGKLPLKPFTSWDFCSNIWSMLLA